MPVQTATPISTGAYNDWKMWGAATKPQAVATNDGVNSCVWAASGGRLLIQTFNFPFIGEVVDPVNAASITAVTRCGETGVGGRSYYLMWNNTITGTNRQQECCIDKYNFKTITQSLAGGDLALAKVNGQHGMRFSAAGGPSQKAEFWVTHVYRVVDFDYPAGGAKGFAHHVAMWAGWAIGTGLLLREMPALARFIGLRSGWWLRPDEYELAWRAWRA